MNRSMEYSNDIVLIVEDTAANSEIIETFLEDINVRCENAFDGLEAVARCGAVEKDYFSLILMDINLPHMNGAKTAKRIRSMGVKAPIVAVTASNKKDRKLREGGKIFDAFLFKPFSYLEFYTAIAPYIKNAMSYTTGEIAVFSGIDALSETDPGVCDVSLAISNMGNNPRLFIKHFKNFRKNNADLSARLQRLIEEGDISGAASLCHSVKGLSGMLALNSVSRHITELEDLLSQSPHFSEGARKSIFRLISSIKEDIRSVCRIQF